MKQNGFVVELFFFIGAFRECLPRCLLTRVPSPRTGGELPVLYRTHQGPPLTPLCFLYMSYEFMTCHKQFRQHLDPSKLKCKASLNEKSQDLCGQKGSLRWIRAIGRNDLQDQAFISSSLHHILLPFDFAWRTDTSFSNCSILILQFLLAIWQCCLINHWN